MMRLLFFLLSHFSSLFSQLKQSFLELTIHICSGAIPESPAAASDTHPASK
jgi:hypothetical protein